jgi:class 3 adenylate cyclase
MFLQVSIVHDGRDGLIFLATGQPAVALQAFARLPAGGLAPWSDDAGQADDDVTGFGRALAQALLPPALQRLLAQAGEGDLQLWLGAPLAAVPWELAQVDGRALDERFVITRQVLADGESGEFAPVAQAAASLQVLDGPARDAGLRAAAAAAGRAGQAALVLPPQATVARQALALALAEGQTIARAAQRARAAARQQRLPGGSAWLYGDGALLAGHRADAAGPLSSGDDVRQVSILSCDLAGSTALMHRLGDEEYSERLARYHQRVADIARAHAGLADDPQGDDGLMCYFGYPVASEDAVAMALRAGLALSTTMQDLDLPLRIGISTGRVVIRNGQPVGAAVHHAARLQQHAAPGNVLVGAATRRIAGDRFTFCLVDAAPQFKGFDEAGAVWRLVGEPPALGTERFDGRDDLAAFVGRQAELAWLQRHWQAAVAGQRQVLLLHGEAGIGKSRLVREFRQSLAQQGQRTLECRCAAEHSGSAFQPLIDLLRRRLQVHETDPAMLQLARLRALQVTTGPDGAQALALLGALLSVPEAVLPPLPGAGSAERRRQRTMALLLQVATGLSDAAPVCLILEDVQWIDPSTRELVQRLIEGPRRQRVLLLLTLRGGAADVAACALAPAGQARLALDGLAPAQAHALLQQASGGVLQDAALAGWLASRADGVPLFIEQSARMAAALAHQRPGADLSRRLQEAVPDTLHDLLMARLDQLPQAKRAAQLGAALGRAFPQALIEAVNGHADAPFHLPAVAAQLDALVQAGLLTVQAEGTQRVYTFRHALLRDAAHQSLLERDRRRLHLAIAAVLQADFAPLCASQPERLALHQALAGQPAQALASWESAARHAASRSALHEAIGHVRSALALLDQLPTPAERDTCELRLQLRLSGLLIATAGYGAERVEAVYRRASALARALGDDRAQARLRLGLQGYHFMRADFAAAQTLADEMAAHLGLQPEPLARLQADWAQANLLFHRGQLPQALALTEQCLADHQRQAPRAGTVQDPAVLCLGYAAWALWQLGRADEALRRAREAVALAEQLNHPFSLGQALGFLAVVHHFRGEALPGLRAAQRAIEVCEGGGFVQWLAHARVLQGRLRVALGEVEAGLADLARGQAEWVASGAVVTRPFYLALQAEALAAAGRPDAALSLLAEAQALVERHGERYYEPELLRLSGALRLDAGEGDASTLPWLEAALASARGLQQPGLALRAALSLAPRWAAQGRRAEARALLADSLAAAPEGAATQDPRQAAALLATWSQ